jgi:hypothetical protein
MTICAADNGGGMEIKMNIVMYARYSSDRQTEQSIDVFCQGVNL